MIIKKSKPKWLTPSKNLVNNFKYNSPFKSSKINSNPNISTSIFKLTRQSNFSIPKKQMNWEQAKSKYNLSAFGDADKDGVKNIFDCRPYDFSKQGPQHNNKFQKIAEAKRQYERDHSKLMKRRFSASFQSISPNVVTVVSKNYGLKRIPRKSLNKKIKSKNVKENKNTVQKRQKMTGIVSIIVDKKLIPMKLSSSEAKQGYIVYKDMQGMGRSVFYGEYEKGLKFKSDIEKQQYYKNKQDERIEKTKSYYRKKDFYDRQAELSSNRTRLGQRRNENEIYGRTLIVRDKTGAIIKKYHPGVFEKAPKYYGETRSLSGELYEPEIDRKEFKNLTAKEKKLLPRTLEQARDTRTFKEAKEDREYNPTAKDLGLQDVTPILEEERYRYKNKKYKPIKLDKNTLDMNRAMVTDKEASYFLDERISKEKLGKGMKRNYSPEKQKEIIDNIKEKEKNITYTGDDNSNNTSDDTVSNYKEDKKNKNIMEDLGIESV